MGNPSFYSLPSLTKRQTSKHINLMYLLLHFFQINEEQVEDLMKAFAAADKVSLVELYFSTGCLGTFILCTYCLMME